MNVKATCANCKCRGKLFKRKREVILIPTLKVNFGVQEEKEEKKRYEKDLLAAHGFATKKQKISVTFLGSLFWLTIVLLANFISLENTKFKPGVGSFCVLEYKKCISEFDWNLCASSMYDCGDMENENYGSFNFTLPQKITKFSNVEKSLAVFSHVQNKANENLCLYTVHVTNNICENLCFSSDFSYDSDENYEFIAADRLSRYNHQKNAECKSICMLASDLEVKEDCPFHKRCPNGCPCPGYKCVENVFDFNLAGVFFHSNFNHRVSSESSLFKISLLADSLKFDELSWTSSHANFCFVQFYGDFYFITGDLADSKLTLYKIDKNGNFEKLSEDYLSVQIRFGDTTKNKICSRGIYKNDEERIIFCSKFESRGICHSYAIKENQVFLTEIYNRPISTINLLRMKQYEVFGLTFNNQLVGP